MKNSSMSRKFRFTKTGLENLPIHERESRSRDQEYCDEQVTGLRLMVSKSGRKFFHFRYSYSKRKRIISIGEFPAVSLQEARERALTFRNMLSKGIDPNAEKLKLQNRLTFKDFAENEYMPYAKQNKKSWKDDLNKLNADMLPSFGNLPLNEITTREVQKYITRITERTSPSTANRHYSLLSRLFNLALQWQYIQESPCRFIKKQKESGGKERFLNDDEIKALIGALEESGNTVATNAIRFLMFTGLRMSEAVTLKWANVNLEASQIKLIQTKAGKARAVVLNELAVDVLKNMLSFKVNAYVFPGSGETGHVACLKRAFEKAKNIAGIKEFRLHDLRHTFASIAINNGASLFEVQKLLGHHSSQMTQRYAHLADESMKNATNGVASKIRKSANI